MRILVVEDDPTLRDGLCAGLKQNGYVADSLDNGELADKILKTEHFDLIIMDLGLPGISGLEVLRNLRAREDSTPVLVLTARDTTEDIVESLNSGADDYLSKPFNFDELLARLGALHRRFSSRAETIIKYGPIELDPTSHTVSLNGEFLNISRREYALLQKLIENPGRALTREQLVQSLYSWDDEVDSNALEVHIHNLRKKVGNKLIRTIRGVGYMVEKNPDGNNKK